MHIDLKNTLALAFLAVSTASASAATPSDVTVTASFGDLTVGTFGSIFGGYNQIAVDGAISVLCAGGADCRTLREDSANPTRTYATAGGSAVHFGFGDGLSPENVFSFTGATSSVPGTGPANTFKLGTFTYTNGSFYDLSYLKFTLTTHSTDAAYNNFTYSGTIQLDVHTQYGRDPLQEADSFTVLGLAGPNVVTVFEQGACPTGVVTCNTGSVEVYGYINSLHVASLTNPTGGVASITAAVPEPETYAMLLAGLGLVGVVVRRKRKKS